MTRADASVVHPLLPNDFWNLSEGMKSKEACRVTFMEAHKAWAAHTTTPYQTIALDILD